MGFARMRGFPFAALALGMLAVAPGAPLVNTEAPAGGGLDVRPDFFRKKGKGQNVRRGKGKSSPPRQRPNRLHVSARVRRKHRRARKER